jgi:hypothetical protein
MTVCMGLPVVHLKCPSRSRWHHLLKTFWAGTGGWTDRQLPDGTVIFTSPSAEVFAREVTPAFRSELRACRARSIEAQLPPGPRTNSDLLTTHHYQLTTASYGALQCNSFPMARSG